MKLLITCTSLALTLAFTSLCCSLGCHAVCLSVTSYISIMSLVSVVLFPSLSHLISSYSSLYRHSLFCRIRSFIRNFLSAHILYLRGQEAPPVLLDFEIAFYIVHLSAATLYIKPTSTAGFRFWTGIVGSFGAVPLAVLVNSAFFCLEVIATTTPHFPLASPAAFRPGLFPSSSPRPRDR